MRIQPPHAARKEPRPSATTPLRALGGVLALWKQPLMPAAERREREGENKRNDGQPRVSNRLPLEASMTTAALAALLSLVADSSLASYFSVHLSCYHHHDGR